MLSAYIRRAETGYLAKDFLFCPLVIVWKCTSFQKSCEILIMQSQMDLTLEISKCNPSRSRLQRKTRFDTKHFVQSTHSYAALFIKMMLTAPVQREKNLLTCMLTVETWPQIAQNQSFKHIPNFPPRYHNQHIHEGKSARLPAFKPEEGQVYSWGQVRSTKMN